MKALRRAALAVGLAGAVASFVRMVVSARPDHRPPAPTGQWRELSGTDLG